MYTDKIELIKADETVEKIQEFKDIVTRIKFLVEYGRLRYIMSG